MYIKKNWLIYFKNNKYATYSSSILVLYNNDFNEKLYTIKKKKQKTTLSFHYRNIVNNISNTTSMVCIFI